MEIGVSQKPQLKLKRDTQNNFNDNTRHDALFLPPTVGPTHTHTPLKGLHILEPRSGGGRSILQGCLWHQTTPEPGPYPLLAVCP